MKSLAVISQKGGCGKSTTAQGVAVEGVRAGLKVALIDLDQQASSGKWGDRREESDGLAVVCSPAARLPKVLEQAKAEGVDFVVIDTPPHAGQIAIEAAKLADRVLIPIEPHISSLETLATVSDILNLAGKPPAEVLINDAPIQGRRHQDAREWLIGQGFKVVPVVLFHRAAHSDAGDLGKTAGELDPVSKAALEMKKLYNYIHKLL